MMGLSVALVLAFGSPATFDVSALEGGGGKVSFTGSPNARWNCSVCHGVAGATSGSLTVSSPTRDLAQLGYVPGETYELEVELHGTVGLRQGFALDINRRDRAPAGTLVAHAEQPNDPLLCYELGIASGLEPVVIFGNTARTYACALTKWRVTWQAPATDEGSVTLYASAVDADKKADNQGDAAYSLVLGIPSPSTVGAKSAGCSTTPAALLLGVLVVWVLRRRRRVAGSLVAALLLLTPSPVEASAPKKGKKTTPKKVQPPPAEEPSPTPAAEPKVDAPVVAEPVSQPTPAAPAPAPAEVAPAPAPVAVAAIADTSSLAGALELDARLGFGFRSVSLASSSYATPFRAGFGYPSLGFGLTLFPMRLLRSTALEGLHLQARYVVGWVVQTLPLAGALVLPSESRIALGYRIRAGALEVTPRALYRVAIGGVERNALFDDGFFQSVEGELGLGVVTGGFFLTLAPRVGAVVDVGTQMVRGYGPSKGGLTFGGSAEVGWRFSPSFLLSASYSLNLTRTSFAGQGTRAFEALTMSDTIHTGFVVARLEH